jgi:hypothetical protein
MFARERGRYVKVHNELSTCKMYATLNPGKAHCSGGPMRTYELSILVATEVCVQVLNGTRSIKAI